MDIKQLIYLCNLERERHFGRAAEASFVSQPTLSMRLKNLERELGVSLINRSNNFAGFTAEGERVLDWAREIVSVYQGLKLEVESLKYGVNGTLRIGVVPQCSLALAALLTGISQQFRQLDYRVAVLSADQLLDALVSHTIDAGIGFFELATLSGLQFQAQPLIDRGVELVFNPAFFSPPVAARLTLSDLAALPLCLAEPTRYFRRYLDSQFREAGVTARIVMESSSIFQLMQAVYCGLGCALSPVGHLLPGMMPALQTLPLEITPMARYGALAIAAPGRATPLAQRFFDAARSTIIAATANPGSETGDFSS
ncbi:LysR family transcriptional regulator [Erwinia sp. OLTSP20]|uniref:LysR family transcriptional regulator n=1 Tax=unclassified Erwinia TaxID=2622719 RepID=UPI000C18C6EF|nr:MULTISPECIES: LysR family transcriptional regulator [unclassified Erwinia]PIJ51864.1 LysR family transcriptional regulator [Erwinia sp. OAMSP11]PIJ74451.1 LysR family transcriptional regulator [Erwinia sp. OLSSP12]PIJ83823.1 LysR family transcriptional regulator [Erwinia sp. OLCASP19]PIJ86867.1 LysR family transcriptional regulator [Erwinia sp. OLMTSP26]PIJ88273.1 LysR family transcriptional regulator [Erwinia sp. OLMDSP33]